MATAWSFDTGEGSDLLRHDQKNLHLVPHRYEVDHLVALAIRGSNDISAEARRRTG
jgi:hypothetical protein